MQSGAEQPVGASEQPVSASEQPAPTVGPEHAFSAYAAEQPLPSLQDVTLDDFDVEMEGPAGNEDLGRLSGPEVGEAQESRGEKAGDVAGGEITEPRGVKIRVHPNDFQRAGETAVFDA